jgi:hydroxymethylpyrimidine/phosphomethylpyrimidine kinase
MIKIAMTIAGSDSVGGAGIQADLKTFQRLETFGVSVLTAITAQNTVGVNEVLFLPTELIAKQLDSVLGDVPVDALKTGMLANAEIVKVVAGKVRQYSLVNLVVDPVLVSTSGHLLLEQEAVYTMKEQLFPLAKIVTPNLPEVKALVGIQVDTNEDMKEAALAICSLGAQNVLVKGGHSTGEATDLFYDGKDFHFLTVKRIGVGSVHGTGCTLSAAIAAYLARGYSVLEAVQAGKKYVTGAIETSFALGKGSRLLNHGY